MKKISVLILIYLILSIDALQIADLKQNQISEFSSDKEAQESIEYTGCLELIEDQNYLNKIKELIEKAGYPEDYDLEEIALSICQQSVQGSEEIQSQVKQMTPLVRSGNLRKATFYKPKDLIDIKDFGSTIFMPPVENPLNNDLDNIKLKSFFGDLFSALGGEFIKVAVEAFGKWLRKIFFPKKQEVQMEEVVDDMNYA